MATLIPEAKQILSRTVRALRERLLGDLHDAAEGRYRLSLPLDKAKLPEELRKKRGRLEDWLDERVRSTSPKDKKAAEAARARFLAEAQKEAAATLLNRLVLLRHLEALGLSRPAVLTGGWTSKGYTELREFAPALCGDETEGYAALLQLVFDELALDLPGLFGDVGLTRLFPVPPATLREVVQRLDDPELVSAWTDDTTLGWVYQYWNDPEREALDAKLNDGGKIEPHEIASKTQMFTERYMVEWLLQNSLGLTWLSMCRKHGWTPDADSVLPVLDARRAEWRERREAGEVALDALMPIEGEREEHWKYYVPQPIPDDALASAPDSVRTLKILDPACGSGHFLVIAFDLLAAMYREEARHRGQSITEKEIAESILENNLHGIDIDPRAVQIAAAAVVLKAKSLAKDARPKRVNLVAPVLKLGVLKDDDPALVRLRRELRAEAGIPEELTSKLVKALAGVDHLGSLLKVDSAIDDAIQEQEKVTGKVDAAQGDLLSRRFPVQQARIDWKAARATVLGRLEAFLVRHSGEEDLGLRLDGEQLAAGVRFVRMVKEDQYDIVIGNPPFLGTNKKDDSVYVANHYPSGKADLYAAFLLRGCELARTSGLCAMITMRSWAFLSQFEGLRLKLFQHHIGLFADLHFGAFSSMKDVSVAMVSIRKVESEEPTFFLRPVEASSVVRDLGQPSRNRAGLAAPQELYARQARDFAAIPGSPLVYWWPADFLERYAEAPKLGELAPSRIGLRTSDNARYLRCPWELAPAAVELGARTLNDDKATRWLPYIKGAAGRAWMDSVGTVVTWARGGLAIKVALEHRYGAYPQSSEFYLKLGIAFTMIGSSFGARAHRVPSIIGDMGSSTYPPDIPAAVCLLNSARAAYVLESLNPTIHFQPGDVARLPMWEMSAANEIFGVVERAFAEEESGREASVEFVAPGPTAWGYAQAWAKRAVDRPVGSAIPAFEPVSERPSPAVHLSYGVGVAFGRFGVAGEGVLNGPPAGALPDGVLFLSGASGVDSLSHGACKLLRAAWADLGHDIRDAADLRGWLRTSFFKHHKAVYENRPVYFPLSSAKRSFVAWVSIHRWTSNTLTTLLADHLVPERRRLEGELDDLRKARAKPDKGDKAGAEKRFADVQKLLEELTEFIDVVTQCAERGPPPTSPNETKREVDARYEMDLDDGVMVNSAPLWPLLEPQWKDPKKWWRELAEAKGRKDYDWAHLAKRYFPSRVEEKCVADPSLAVAHGCFWRLHPAKAYAWELRLQDEIRPDFTIDEPGSDAYRAKFLKSHASEALAIRQKEAERRERKARKAGDDENLSLGLPEAEADQGEEEAE